MLPLGRTPKVPKKQPAPREHERGSQGFNRRKNSSTGSVLDAMYLEKLKAALEGRYAIDKEVGRGGAATVYLAHEVKHERPVAIKVLHPELATAVGLLRFTYEIEVTAKLQHPHIVPLLDSGAAGELFYFVTPYVNGHSLVDRLHDGGLSVAEALQIGAEVADALDHAHQQSIAHLDIKPGNILLSNGHAMIADFGISRAICQSCREPTANPGMLVGTPEYMSPEQAAGFDLLDGRSDIYSLACVVYEMLTGSPPFEGDSPETIIYQHLEAAPPSVRQHRSDVPAQVDRVLQKALAKDPEGRLGTAGEFATALRQAARSIAGRHSPAQGLGGPAEVPASRANAQALRYGLASIAILTALGAIAVASNGVERRSVDQGPMSAEAAAVSDALASFVPVKRSGKPLERC